MLWLLGTLGFALRGGIVLLTLPILVLPTQVEVRLALGGNLGSTGLTAGFWGLVALGSLLTAFAALLVLLLLARVEMASFHRLAVDPESGDMRAWQAPRPMSGGRQRLLFSRIFTIQALALVGLALFALPLAASVGPATLDELLRPTSSATIYVRVLDQLVPQLIVFGIGLVVVEMVSAVATRTLLLHSAGFRNPARRGRQPLIAAVLAGLSGPFRSPLRTLRTSALGWLATLTGAAAGPVGDRRGVAGDTRHIPVDDLRFGHGARAGIVHRRLRAGRRLRRWPARHRLRVGLPSEPLDGRRTWPIGHRGELR